MTLITSSGALVPNATTVSPMTMFGTLKAWAIPEAPLTKLAPPTNSKRRPNKTKRKGVKDKSIEVKYDYLTWQNLAQAVNYEPISAVEMAFR